MTDLERKTAARRVTKHRAGADAGLPRRCGNAARRALALAMIAAVAIGAATAARAAEVWLAGVDPLVRQAMAPGQASDYMALFRPDAAWKQAAARVAVFKTSTQFMEGGAEDDLRRMFADLRARGIRLALEAIMVPRTGDCGQGVEAYADPRRIPAVLERIRRLGGTLDSIAMDEPLWFGHDYDGPHACHADIAEIARAVAVNVKVARTLFPQVKIGDVEPMATRLGPDWTMRIAEWADAYRAATGLPLAFLHADVEWDDGAADRLALLAREMRRRAIPIGFIYDGNPSDPTDLDWTAAAEARFEATEADGSLVPDHAILQSWMDHPARFLPEDEPGTMTSLVPLYAKTRTAVALDEGARAVAGRLVTATGTPVGGGALSLVTRQSGTDGLLSERRLAGTVPADAVRAVFGLRLNTECVCGGQGDVGIGRIAYREAGRSAVFRVLPQRDGGGRDPHAVAQFHVARNDRINIGTPAFPVTAGQPFHLTVPLRASPDVHESGYVAIIFLRGDGTEVKRLSVPLTVGDAAIATTTTTDREGRFVFPVAPPAGPATILFRGGPDLRWAARRLSP